MSDKIDVVFNADGSKTIKHPTSVEQHIPQERVLREGSITTCKRKSLIENINCGYHCPKDRPFFCCKQEGCKENKGFFNTDEKLQFSEEEINNMKTAWDEKTGYLGINGCRLPRKLRSLACLEWICKED